MYKLRGQRAGQSLK